MSTYYTSMLEFIGHTPLFQPQRWNKRQGVCANLLVKIESFNPTGSAKDRIALAMIQTAEQEGKLTPDSVIIEPTSGNTGIALAAVAAAKGYRALLVMPETMSIERRNLIAAYGAEIVLTNGTKGMQGAVDKATELAQTIPHAFIPGQFINPANPAIHYQTTGPEIYQDTEGEIHYFIAGIGTGGTISGISRYLKEQNPAIQIIAVEPESSPLLSEGHSGPHKIQGLGANFIPQTLCRTSYDAITTVSNEDAFRIARNFTKTEGIFVGISSGAALYAALKIGKLPQNSDKTIIVFLPDNGDRYLTTENFI
ncbi:cysteine synthase A [uncultured Megasphaera sp.]|uniref:cysteine synthase A n=1 Tax=uncultured Megasphaera sp. TaxID=165188 RepID=UPI00259624AD|nr:cysteine synthase A [uncultured Megasphaera sp.]